MLILLWIITIGWCSAQPINARTKKCREYIHACCLRFFSLSYPRVFAAHEFVELPPFRYSYPGSHGTHSSPFPTTVLAFVLISRKEKKCSELSFLPCRPLASNWFAFMQPTINSIIRRTQAARRFLLSVRILIRLFQALISTRTNMYVISCDKCIFTCNIVSMS